MEIEIREMRKEESMKIWQLGLLTFHSLEGIFLGKPKQAIVAVSEGNVVGGVTYKVYSCKNVKLGYVDYAFVDKQYHGQGIGKKLYFATTERLKELGCSQTFGLVRGDNPSSFTLFEKQKMERCNLLEMKHVLGFSGLMTLLFATPFSWGPTADCYLSTAKKRRDGAIQMLYYFFINLIMMLLGIGMYKTDILFAFLSAATVLGTSILFSLSILLFNRSDYHFRFSLGGGFVTAIVTLIGGFFPMCGKWYPQKFEDTKKQKKELAISAVIEWLGFLGLYTVVELVAPDMKYWNCVSYFSSAMVVFHMLPTYPFNEYGASRVYKYSKILYCILWAISAGVLFLTL